MPGFVKMSVFLDTVFCRIHTSPDIRKQTISILEQVDSERRQTMKGYYVSDGYMGLINGIYRLFANESDYRDYLED